MKLSITGHHIEVTPAINEHVHIKMRRPETHFTGTIEAHVVLTHLASKAKEERNVAEVNVLVQGKALHASATHGDMYSAIDEMVNKISTQLDKYKAQKKFDHSVPHIQ